MAKKETQHIVLLKSKPQYVVPVVEETGFEPTTSWSRTKRATKLRYSSKKFRIPCVDPELVEVTGLEPTTSWSLTKRATKLRYTSIKSIFYYKEKKTRVK